MMVIIGGYLLDLAMGDPQSFPHPVRLMGRLISFLDNKLNKEGGRTYQLIMGCLLSILVVLTVYMATHYIIKLAYLMNFYFGTLMSLYLAYTVLATRSLGDEGRKIYRSLVEKDIPVARKNLSYIVGRDTENLNEEGIARATIETIAENTSDGIIAPLFYLFVGGVPMAMAYKAINTLDSMVGYKNEKYLYFGRVSAKLDDVANYIPARLTVAFLFLASILTGDHYKNGLKTAIRDGKNHSSPNSGYPEALVAGALMIQLGGANFYFGKRVDKPTIGNPIKAVDSNMIIKTIKLMYGASFIGFLFFIFVKTFVRGFVI